MTETLSHDAEMLRRVIAMMCGLPIDSDPALREDASGFTLLDGMFEGWQGYASALREITPHVLNTSCTLTPGQCRHTLRWVLEKTGLQEALRMLAWKNTAHFLRDGDTMGDLFDDDILIFFKEFVDTLSVRQKLIVAKVCMDLADQVKETQYDFLGFARDVLLGIKYEMHCPADHRRNLIVGGLDMLIDVQGRGIVRGVRHVSRKDVAFGIVDMVISMSGGKRS
jgi:hypothetical protein